MPHDLPDIVLVVFDTARRDRFGCYGYDRPTTPTVDALAHQGLLVDTMLTTGPYTLPSHGSLFTGLYPTQHGCQWQTGPRMRDSVTVTMAEWLRDLGYETVCATNNGLISNRTRLARGFTRYAFRLDLERGRRRALRRMRKAISGGDSGGATINRWLRHELPNIRKPLFLFVNYLECHWAYAPPRRFVKQVGGPRMRLLEGLRYRMRFVNKVGPWEAIATSDDRRLEVYSALYDAELANADSHLQELMKILKTTGHLREGKTVVIVTSDHGEHIGEHGLADHHGSLDDHLLRVPFVIWGPGLVPATRKTGLYEFVDILPSLASFLGQAPPAEYLQGRRTTLFAPNGRSTDKEPHDYAFAEWRCWHEKEQARLAKRNPSYDFTQLRRNLVSARDQRFKLVRGSDGTESLFDLFEDPEEEGNVASFHPRETHRLAAKLNEAVASWKVWEQEEEPLTPEERQAIENQLAALGYI